MGGDAPRPARPELTAEKFAGGGSTKDSTKAAGEAYKQQQKDSAAAAKKKRLATPAIYNDIDKTPLRAEVPAQTEYRFELKRDPK